MVNEIIMKQHETNLSRVRSAFEDGLILTVVKAITLCNTSELRVYVTKLIREGLNIKSEWKENNGKRFKIHWLESLN